MMSEVMNTRMPSRLRISGPVPTTYSWNSTGEIGHIGRHRAETHRYFNIRVFGQMPPDASDFTGGIPAYAVFSEVSSFSTDMHIAEVITFSYYFSLQNKSASSLCPLHMSHVKKDPSVCEIVYMESDLKCVNCRVSDDG